MPGYDSSRRSQLPRRTKLQHGLPWARSVCRVRTSHNTIILHRKYLGRSFRDPFYAFTRWASIDASKKIIRETRAASKDPNRPIIWNDQAHLTGAGVTLCLDVMHRAPGDSELTEHRALVDEAMTLLSNSKDSVLASRGHKLLSSMLKKSTAESTSKTMSDAFGCPGTTLADASKAWPIESSNSLQTVVESAGEQPQAFATPDSEADLAKTRTNASPIDTVDMTPSFTLANVDEVLTDASWTETSSRILPRPTRLRERSGLQCHSRHIGPILRITIPTFEILQQR
ncbi:hypothetical protein CLAFUW4_08921 [Fulvia fulva]|uniref:Uncharacterized protein n=1 Tax=Passalora fulva TaxID=5499 RepID=A0A9Q8UTX9_PASFU|nr:uncharacterized protein CLAFUR5_09030 [Fulvia fulva]KAK4613772.1 hypothetical protein CLAFUR4_08927 [Fulvia fulva]KAK4614393.1 hypothetical protein CLAFUR0_08919 [Fulvia fulva]UJO22283.1 hypothetical protein CLAFUR5_09030 [Fulvia fulva]WPV20740.1 hypothetical protein CLAFUW4_08921 [Fulvia fulva]WPV35184.1 hypothetical protein CLAFUW7_08922 [Fulvia fulva]